MKSGNLNFLELSGPLQACNGTALPFTGQAARGWKSEMKMWSGKSGNALLVRNFNKNLHVVLQMTIYICITGTLHTSHYFSWPILFVTSCLFLTYYHLSLPIVIPMCMWVSSWVATNKLHVTWYFSDRALWINYIQWNLDLLFPQRLFSRMYRSPFFVPNEVPYK